MAFSFKNKKEDFSAATIPNWGGGNKAHNGGGTLLVKSRLGTVVPSAPHLFHTLLRNQRVGKLDGDHPFGVRVGGRTHGVTKEIDCLCVGLSSPNCGSVKTI